MAFPPIQYYCYHSSQTSFVIPFFQVLKSPEDETSPLQFYVLNSPQCDVSTLDSIETGKRHAEANVTAHRGKARIMHTYFVLLGQLISYQQLT